MARTAWRNGRGDLTRVQSRNSCGSTQNVAEKVGTGDFGKIGGRSTSGRQRLREHCRHTFA
jgi:hypothetical protein